MVTDILGKKNLLHMLNVYSGLYSLYHVVYILQTQQDQNFKNLSTCLFPTMLLSELSSCNETLKVSLSPSGRRLYCLTKSYNIFMFIRKITEIFKRRSYRCSLHVFVRAPLTSINSDPKSGRPVD